MDRVQVFITNAKADLARGRQRVPRPRRRGLAASALACKPQGGKPADRPFDCEVQRLMRTLFVAYLVLIAAGLAYAFVLALGQ